MTKKISHDCSIATTCVQILWDAIHISNCPCPCGDTIKHVLESSTVVKHWNSVHFQY